MVMQSKINGAILDFEERRDKLHLDRTLHDVTQAISISALLDITQEINSVVHFYANMQKGITATGKQNSENLEKRVLLIALSRLCHIHGNNLLAIHKATEKELKSTTAAEQEAAADFIRELEKQSHSKILDEWIAAFSKPN